MYYLKTLDEIGIRPRKPMPPKLMESICLPTPQAWFGKRRKLYISGYRPVVQLPSFAAPTLFRRGAALAEAQALAEAGWPLFVSGCHYIPANREP
jgi:hypothetical protein